MNIIGHQKKLSQLQNFLARGLIFPALLFEGPEKVGKFTIAKAFIKGLRCDKKIIGGCSQCQGCASVDYNLSILDEPRATAYRQETGKDGYGIEMIQKLIEFVQTTPLQADYKIILIDNAHQLSFEAQNKLLKILEEPPSYCLFILISHKPESLARTIRSRCLTINFGLAPRETIFNGLIQNKYPNSLAKSLSQYSLGRPGLAINLNSPSNKAALFRAQALAILKFQTAPFPGRLTLIPKQDKDSPRPPFPLLDLFQITMRDALLHAYGIGEQSVLLTRKQPLADLEQKLKALRESLRLADIIEDAVSPLATTRCFEYLAIKL